MPIICFLGNETETDEVLYYVSKIIWCQNGIAIDIQYLEERYFDNTIHIIVGKIQTDRYLVVSQYLINFQAMKILQMFLSMHS